MRITSLPHKIQQPSDKKEQPKGTFLRVPTTVAPANLRSLEGRAQKIAPKQQDSVTKEVVKLSTRLGRGRGR